MRHGEKKCWYFLLIIQFLGGYKETPTATSSPPDTGGHSVMIAVVIIRDIAYGSSSLLPFCYAF